MKKLQICLAAALLSTACAGSPVAPAAAAPIAPTYVVIGDSLGLGGQWTAVEAALPAHQWVNTAVGSTFIHTQWQPGGSAFEAMKARVTTAPKAFLAHLGANDTVLQPPPTEASVYADLQRLATELSTLYPGSVLYLADVGQVWTYGDKRAENAQVRAAIERAWREIPSVRQGPLMRDLTPDDGVHFTSPQNVQTIADRWIQALR